jgi:DNA-binding transcriptional MerR regulator
MIRWLKSLFRKSDPPATAATPKRRKKYDRYTDDQKVFVSRARKLGVSWSEIAKELGAPNAGAMSRTAYSWRDRHGVGFPITKPKRPKRPSAAEMAELEEARRAIKAD